MKVKSLWLCSYLVSIDALVFILQAVYTQCSLDCVLFSHHVCFWNIRKNIRKRTCNFLLVIINITSSVIGLKRVCWLAIIFASSVMLIVIRHQWLRLFKNIRQISFFCEKVAWQISWITLAIVFWHWYFTRYVTTHLRCGGIFDDHFIANTVYCWVCRWN